MLVRVTSAFKECCMNGAYLAARFWINEYPASPWHIIAHKPNVLCSLIELGSISIHDVYNGPTSRLSQVLEIGLLVVHHSKWYSLMCLVPRSIQYVYDRLGY